MNTVMLMAAPGGAQGQGGGSFQLIIMVGIILVFWIFMIRPQQKKAKDQKNFIDNIQKGDRVVTIAGIHGVINKVNEDGTFQLEVSPGSYLKIEKSAISTEWSAALNKSVATTDK
ncbi:MULTISPECIES: preprotein translocase subunit YajC [Chitinophagaceae]